MSKSCFARSSGVPTREAEVKALYHSFPASKCHGYPLGLFSAENDLSCSIPCLRVFGVPMFVCLPEGCASGRSPPQKLSPLAHRMTENVCQAQRVCAPTRRTSNCTSKRGQCSQHQSNQGEYVAATQRDVQKKICCCTESETQNGQERMRSVLAQCV